MTYDSYTLFTALLALLANGVTGALVVVFAGARFGIGRFQQAAEWLRALSGLYDQAARAATSI